MTFGKYPIILILIAFATCSFSLKLSSIEKNYNKGYEAHSGERWSKCIEHFEETLHLYKLYKSIIMNCRLECNSKQYTYQIIGDIEDLQIYEHFFNKKKCLNDCQEKSLGGIHVHSDSHDNIHFNMQTREPYKYLHLCYLQMYNLPKAASAAYTYLTLNINDDVMKKNLQYYIEQPEVDIKEVVDLESEDYEVLYGLGLKAYKEKKYGETVASMEEVLTDYFSWENVCRVECEYQPGQEWSPEFVKTIANNIASLLQCKQQCQNKLRTLNYKSGIEFLADILNYLQISYYHLERYDDAAKAVSSYLLLIPKDEDMIENKNIYSSLADKKSFVERSDITYYSKRDKSEKILLDMYYQEKGDVISY